MRPFDWSQARQVFSLTRAPRSKTIVWTLHGELSLCKAAKRIRSAVAFGSAAGKRLPLQWRSGPYVFENNDILRFRRAGLFLALRGGVPGNRQGQDPGSGGTSQLSQAQDGGDFTRSSGRPSSRPLLGWREYLALPELGLDAIRVKVDTGARSSAIGVSAVELYKTQELRRVRFSLGGIASRNAERRVELPVEALREVRSSNGAVEQRITVRTLFRVGEWEYAFDLTLTDRASMRFPMLLGREAIRGRFLVDPGKSFLFGKPKNKRKPK